MSKQEHRYSPEDVARRGDEIYDRSIRARVEGSQPGRVVAIDIESEDYAIEDTAVAAARLLRTRRPDAKVWLIRIGHRALRRIGGRFPKRRSPRVGMRRLVVTVDNTIAMCYAMC